MYTRMTQSHPVNRSKVKVVKAFVYKTSTFGPQNHTGVLVLSYGTWQNISDICCNSLTVAAIEVKITISYQTN